ncbi:MAG TPA: prephenate dehydrogenase/arogenate dehydrogenase family protein [Acidimicrobiales bacterium]|nr:prephenate dehydrogenase/arogenate dehydrogenase family protein [Acidimicrobiales bacterium]
MEPRRAAIVGTGLIGGSIGLALRARGWHVTGTDHDQSRAGRAVELGAIDEVGDDPTAEITFVATPVGEVVDVARRVSAAGGGAVTDVGGVKQLVVSGVDHPRFVGGHPMAGSEQEGIEGATADLFDGAVWVLTPTAATDDAAYTTVRSVVASLGAEVVELDPDRHDRLVAVVSHVPHLTAAALVTMAAERSEEHRALLRLAAGGFRDMTRVASGHPAIWPDVCAANRGAILDTLDDLSGALAVMRDIVERGDPDELLAALGRARAARTSLPSRGVRPDELAEVKVPIRDRRGELASVTTLATDLDVNIYDIEIDHSAEGDRGVLVLVVDAERAERLIGGLLAVGYRPSSRSLT